MGILSNWKKGREERIAAAKARNLDQQKQVAKQIASGAKLVMDTSKVDPKARVFLEYVSKLLEEHGVSNKEVREQCCYDLFETMTRSFNQAALDRGPVQDKFLMEMAASLHVAGITVESEQEDIIIKFLAKFKRISGM